MLPIHFNFGCAMSEHDSVTQLKQWLEQQNNPVLTRADKIVNWATQHVPGFKKVISSQLFRNAVLLAPLPMLLIPFFQYLPKDVVGVFTFLCIFLTTPALVRWCTNINWQNTCDTLTPSTPSDLERLREKLQRVQIYHPELHFTIQQTFDALSVRSSKFSADQLDTILNNILLNLPVLVDCNNSAASHPSFDRTSSGLKV